MHIKLKNKKLYFHDYKIKCAIGKSGISAYKREGDGCTPKGIFKFKYIFYRKDKIKGFKTKLKTVVIKKNMGWCNDSKSKNYNKLIKLPSNNSYEKLYRKENIYDIILVLNYNMSPVIKNKGSAICIHISRKNYKKTEGCVAVKKRDLIEIVKKLQKNTKVKIVNQK